MIEGVNRTKKKAQQIHLSEPSLYNLCRAVLLEHLAGRTKQHIQHTGQTTLSNVNVYVLPKLEHQQRHYADFPCKSTLEP